MMKELLSNVFRYKTILVLVAAISVTALVDRYTTCATPFVWRLIGIIVDYAAWVFSISFVIYRIVDEINQELALEELLEEDDDREEQY